MKVAVLMLTYNNRDEATVCIQQVIDSLNGHRLIIWDNGSEFMNYPGLHQLQNWEYLRDNLEFTGSPDNLGVAGGRNKLIELALKTDADVFVFLDSDVEVLDSNWIERLIKPLAQENVGIAGCAGSYVDWGHSHPFVPARVGECDVVSGWCLAVTREVVELTGVRMDEGYGKFYEEDSDFCMQVREAGFDVWCVGHIGLKHMPSNSGAHLAVRVVTLQRFVDKWMGKGLMRIEGAYG